MNQYPLDHRRVGFIEQVGLDLTQATLEAAQELGDSGLVEAIQQYQEISVWPDPYHLQTIAAHDTNLADTIFDRAEVIADERRQHEIRAIRQSGERASLRGFLSGLALRKGFKSSNSPTRHAQ